MQALKRARKNSGFSQRRLAALSGLSYKSLQLLESRGHDPKLSTVEKVVTQLGYPPSAIRRCIEAVLSDPPDSIIHISERIAWAKAPWKIWLFTCVDAFRNTRDGRYVAVPPIPQTPDQLKALCAATVETLCDELGLPVPSWCAGISPLRQPWFVAELDAVKAAALVESPIHFRKRNIFVLQNFLHRR